MQRKDLKKFLKQKKFQMEQKLDETTDIIIMSSEEIKKSSGAKNDENSDENSILNGLNGDDNIESDTRSKGEIK
jgi:hypothetical protein